MSFANVNGGGTTVSPGVYSGDETAIEVHNLTGILDQNDFIFLT